MNYQQATKAIENFDLHADEQMILETMKGLTKSASVIEMVEDQLTNDFSFRHKDEDGRSGYICNMAHEWLNVGRTKSAVIAYAKALLKAEKLVNEYKADIECQLVQSEIEAVEHERAGDVTVIAVLVNDSDFVKAKIDFRGYRGFLFIKRTETKTIYTVNLCGAGRPVITKVVKK